MRKRTCACGNDQLKGGQRNAKEEPHVLVPVKLLNEMQCRLDQLNRAMYKLNISAVAFEPELQAPRLAERRPQVAKSKQPEGVIMVSSEVFEAMNMLPKGKQRLRWQLYYYTADIR